MAQKKSPEQEKCYSAVRIAKEHLGKLTQSEISNLLYTFAEPCSNNAEFSETNSDILFLVIEKQPSLFLKTLEVDTLININRVLGAIKYPLLSPNIVKTYKSVKSDSSVSKFKVEVLKMLESAAKYVGQKLN